MLAALAPVRAANTSGLFLDSCHTHCQGGSASTWSGPQGPQVGNTVINNSVLSILENKTYMQKKMSDYNHYF